MHRLVALGIAVVAWLGLGVQFGASVEQTGTVGGALWAMLRYFTVIANILVALVFTLIAKGRGDSSRVLGGVTVAILLVGIVYGVLLDGLLSLSGGAWVADMVLHRIVPLLVALYWLGLAPRGGLAWKDPLAWVLLPLCYFGYALVRGAVEGRYAYPFLDGPAIGWGVVIAHAALMAVGFLGVGFAMVWLDRYLARAFHVA